MAGDYSDWHGMATYLQRCDLLVVGGHHALGVDHGLLVLEILIEAIHLRTNQAINQANRLVS